MLSCNSESAAGALQNLASTDPTNQDAIREAGAIPPLVALLHAGAESKAAESAAGALWNLANNPTNRDAIREAGAIQSLVALLHAGAESTAAENAALALSNLAANNPTNQDAIVAAVTGAVTGAVMPLDTIPKLQRMLLGVALLRLHRAEACEDDLHWRRRWRRRRPSVRRTRQRRRACARGSTSNGRRRPSARGVSRSG